MKIAIIGQSVFGAEVYKLLRDKGHTIVGVFTIPDKNNREDPLALQAAKDSVPVFKFPKWRKKVDGVFKVLPDVFSEYSNLGAELNVLPFCSQFIPMEIITAPKHQSIIYHPSLLPKHRGASAINWTLINGDIEAGFTIFWADDGLDTGPILLMKECVVLPEDTVDTIYTRFMMPEGIKAMGEAVDLIEAGKAPKTKQPEEGASYEPYITAKPEYAKIDWSLCSAKLHDFIRGCDKVPGAWALDDQGSKVIFYASSMFNGKVPDDAKEVSFADCPKPGFVTSEGLLLPGSDAKYIRVKQVKLESGKMINASEYGSDSAGQEEVLLTEEEECIQVALRSVWQAILKLDNVEADTDFFKCGAGSMDVTRLVEEIKDRCDIELENTDVYMAPTFAEFTNAVVLKKRHGNVANEIKFHPVVVHVNSRTLSFPHQLFINGQFTDSSSGRDYDTINPHDQSVICKVAKGNKQDVDLAVKAAKSAFEEGEWGKMSARERGRLLYKLADLMEANKEELATIESLDSGAVYTLALKTHVGMSIETWRYFAGWCDKIQGSTIPINHARPNRNLTLTKREPIGVCGLVTPWNYPLMMLSWKMAACLAAGNTVVHKPAQVSPLTALKFAELVARAGIPQGVVNIVTGSGSEVGQVIVDHPDVRKVGFTGSTPIGAQLMKSCALSNIKRVSLELGGKSPLIIFADCDFEKAVRQSLGAAYFNKGENCIAAGRIFVAQSIYDKFVQRLMEETKKMTIGDPLDRATSHGPQNHKAHLDKLVLFCERGVKEGAKLVYGGKQVDMPGLYFHPTIFADVTDDMYIAKEESFGPIMILLKFEDQDIDGVIARANNSEFGLASGVFSNDINKVMKVAEKLEAGTVFVNTYNKTDVAAPFGGCKQSGFGKDLGEAALNEYLKTKTITIEY